MRRVNRKMNSNYSTQLCRLCLETSSGLLNVFEHSTIASVLATHFWFQINKDDGMPEWVCETCWTHTKTFHDFYKRLELRHQNHLNSIVLLKEDEIKRERSVSPIIAVALEADFVIEKYEEKEITEATEDPQTLSKESIFDKDNKETSCDLRDADQAAEDEHQRSLDKPKNVHHSKVEVEKQDAEIRRFFKMKCEICSDLEFDSLKSMRKHYRQVHKTNGYLTCCGNKYTKRCLMLDHIQYHVNPEAHRCDQCGKNFIGKKALEKHIKNHVRAHQCSLCSKAYTAAVLLKYHVRDKHPTDTSVKFHCDICGKTYPTKISLTGHIRNIHDATLDNVCDVCGRSFKTKNYLQIHRKLEHSTTPPPKVQCDICGIWLKHARRLPEHFKWHQAIRNAKEGNAKVLNCPICKKKVRNKRLLASHIRCAHGERKHQCTFCDKAFKRPKNLKEHIALHTGEELYSCTYCDKTFKSNANMYSHRKKAHTAEWTRDKAEKNSGAIK